jgi:hypothetical protein
VFPVVAAAGLIAVVVLAPSCVRLGFDTGRHSTSPDATRTDSTRPDATRTDATRTDSTRPDSTRDLPPTRDRPPTREGLLADHLAAPHEGSPGMDGPPSICAVLYGSKLGPGDSVCPVATNTFCRVAVALGNQTCAAFCAGAGGTCLGSLGNAAGSPCVPTNLELCTDKGFDAICTCSRPGGGPPVTCIDRFPDGLVCSSAGSVCTVEAPLWGTQSCNSYCGKAGYKCIDTIYSGNQICQGSTHGSCTETGATSDMCVCAP